MAEHKSTYKNTYFTHFIFTSKTGTALSKKKGVLVLLRGSNKGKPQEKKRYFDVTISRTQAEFHLTLLGNVIVSSVTYSRLITRFS